MGGRAADLVQGDLTTAVLLVYETHSTTVDNEQGIATGWHGGVLSTEGRRQARRLGERRQDVDIVYASDLARAVETARLAFEGTDITVVLDSRLRECDYGQLNGRPREHIEAERLQRLDVPFPGGESYRDVVARTRSFLVDIAAEHDGKRVLAIGHAANRWALQHLLEGRDLERLVAAPFVWEEGWTFSLESGF